MAITDRAVEALRRLFGTTRDARDSAESPSADALRFSPSSTYAIWGREDIGGMLSVSQNLMDRYADYEAMNDYPDIRCFAGETRIYTVDEQGLIVPTTIKKLAVDGEGQVILGYDIERKTFKRVIAERPRLSGRNAPVLKIKFSNGEDVRVTPEHKILTVGSGYKEAKDLRKGDFVVGARTKMPTDGKTLLTVHLAGGVWVTEDPYVDGVCDVFDVTTETHNILANGVVCHNSAFHYFANDATQPNLDNGRVVWFTSPDQAIIDAADSMVKRRLRLEDDLFSIAYTLCQYGNDMEEVLVTENGVVGLNALAVPTIRRVEKLNGSLIGYVQDVTGRFTANQDELRRMLAGNVTVPRHVAVFEDWQVAHFRLRSHARRSPYGMSCAEGARWIWKRLVMLEDAVMIYKLTRAPARYAFYVDVTDVPANRVESFLKRAKRDLKKKKMVNPNNNFLDMRYNPLCLSAETKIPLLDGSEKTLLEMVEAHKRGEEQWVYSVDVENGNKLVPGKVTWAGPTRKNAQLLKITLDNGESIKVTPDHKMIRRSGEFAEAQTLRVGDSLMPFRTRVNQIRSDGPEGYEQVYDPSAKDYVFTHQMVAKELGIKTRTSGYVVHHEDLNKRNNSPCNLVEMEWGAHKALHHELSRGAAEKLIAYNKSPEKRAKTAEQNREHDKPAKMRAAITPEIRAKQKKAARKSKKAFWKDSARAEQAAQRMRYVYPGEFVAEIRKLVLEHPTAGAPTIARLANERGLIELLREANPSKADKLKNIHRDMIRWMCQSLGYKSLKAFKDSATDLDYFVQNLRSALRAPVPHNHKVAKIELLEEREDTYTLTVDTAHTFATSCGVFVKNSNDEDFFIAVREGRALSRVEVLSGPDYQAINDVEYFQRKLHGALMVPRAFMGQDAPIQGRAILSNEDVRAARVTLQIQRELKNGIEQLVRTDFAARGMKNPWALDFEVMMTVPSNIYELAAMEVKNARADFASRIQPYVSARWVLEHIFKFTDQEIEKVEKERQREAAKADRMGMDPLFGSFTGGKPLSHTEQAMMAAQGGTEPGMLPPQAMPPSAQGQQAPGLPGPPAAPPPAGAPQVAWKTFDNARRLEERRYRESVKNHQQLVDMIGELQEHDEHFARQIHESRAFMQEFKAAALRNVNGSVVAVPSASPRRFSSSNSM